MKGNQGLELLASMSGDASKVAESSQAAAAPGTATASVAAPSPSPAWPPQAGANPAAIVAALSQQGNTNLIQAAAGLLLQQQQQQQQPAALQQHVHVQDPASVAAHLAQYHILQQAQAAAAAPLAQAAAANPAALAFAVAAQQQQQAAMAKQQQQAEQSKKPAIKPASSLANTPIPIAAAPPKEAKRRVEPAPIAAAPATISIAGSSAVSVGGDSLSLSLEEKKVQKRAANRRSAQLSRKRKKQFIEDLREENAILRRKEQILRAIPDLVVVFDSAGRLQFVSQSVSRLLAFSPNELDGSSFWDRLCGESVRLLKAAFMDALAARSSSSSSSSASSKGSSDADGDESMGTTSESVPLGSGMWELRLVDKDGTHHLVTLSGVVHFSSDESGHSNPECVCSIRPQETAQNHLRPAFAVPPESKRARISRSQADTNVVDPSSSSCSDDGNDGASNAASTTSEGGQSSNTESGVHFQPNLVRDAIKPQQSVISNLSYGSTSALSSDGDGTGTVFSKRGKDSKQPSEKKAAAASASKSTAQISDGDSIISESSCVRIAG